MSTVTIKGMKAVRCPNPDCDSEEGCCVCEHTGFVYEYVIEDMALSEHPKHEETPVSETTIRNDMSSFSPADRIVVTPEYLAGRRARAEGLGFSACPAFADQDRWCMWILGWFDERHGVPVERRAAPQGEAE